MNKDAVVVGGLAIGAVAIAAVLAGRQHSNISTFASASPDAVAAVENGIGAQIASMNAAGVEKAQIAAQTILGLASAQQTLLVSQHQDDTQLEETRVSTAAATSQAQIAADAATRQADRAAAAAQAVAQINANATTEVARNQTTQVQAAAGAQKTSAFWNSASSIISSIGGLFKHL